MDQVVIGGWLRLVLAMVLFCAALGLAGLGLQLGWGIGWMAWIPAICLLFPCMALAGRRILRRVPDGLEIHDGRLFRRILSLSLHACEVEVLPAGGAWAVVLHHGGRELPLASWVTRNTAEHVAALCSPAPRRSPRTNRGDR